MEHLWSRAGATGGNRSQMRLRRNGSKWARTVAVGCERLPIGAHGKGALPPCYGGGRFPGSAKRGRVPRTRGLTGLVSTLTPRSSGEVSRASHPGSSVRKSAERLRAARAALSRFDPSSTHAALSAVCLPAPGLAVGVDEECVDGVVVRENRKRRRLKRLFEPVLDLIRSPPALRRTSDGRAGPPSWSSVPILTSGASRVRLRAARDTRELLPSVATSCLSRSIVMRLAASSSACVPAAPNQSLQHRDRRGSRRRARCSGRLHLGRARLPRR
jgi:hypothetical protein